MSLDPSTTSRSNAPTDRDPQGAVRAAEIAIAAGEWERAERALDAALAAVEERRDDL